MARLQTAASADPAARAGETAGAGAAAAAARLAAGAAARPRGDGVPVAAPLLPNELPAPSAGPGAAQLQPDMAAAPPGAQYVALVDSDQDVVGLLMLSPDGCYAREDEYWELLDPDSPADDTDRWMAVDVPPRSVAIFDSADKIGAHLTESDVD